MVDENRTPSLSPGDEVIAHGRIERFARTDTNVTVAIVNWSNGRASPIPISDVEREPMGHPKPRTGGVDYHEIATSFVEEHGVRMQIGDQRDIVGAIEQLLVNETCGEFERGWDAALTPDPLYSVQPTANPTTVPDFEARAREFLRSYEGFYPDGRGEPQRPTEEQYRKLVSHLTFVLKSAYDDGRVERLRMADAPTVSRAILDERMRLRQRVVMLRNVLHEIDEREPPSCDASYMARLALAADDKAGCTPQGTTQQACDEPEKKP